jgi:hypothetical protein
MTTVPYLSARNVRYIFHLHDISAKQEVAFFTKEIEKRLQMSERFCLCNSEFRF